MFLCLIPGHAAKSMAFCLSGTAVDALIPRLGCYSLLWVCQASLLLWLISLSWLEGLSFLSCPWTLSKSLIHLLRWGNQNYVQQVCTVDFTKKHLIFKFFFLLSILLFCFLSHCQGVWTNFLTALIAAAPRCCSCISASSRYPSSCVESQDVPPGSVTPHLFLLPAIHHGDCSDTQTGKVHLQIFAGGPQCYRLDFLCLIHRMSPSQSFFSWSNSGFLGRTAPGSAGPGLPRWACPEHSPSHPTSSPHLHNQLFIHANTPAFLQYFS